MLKVLEKYVFNFKCNTYVVDIKHAVIDVPTSLVAKYLRKNFEKYLSLLTITFKKCFVSCMLLNYCF